MSWINPWQAFCVLILKKETTGKNPDLYACKSGQMGVSMYEIMEIIKEFAVLVMTKTCEELIGNAERGMGVMFFCMLAFSFIMAGIFLKSRLADVYCILPGGKKKLLGDIYLKDTKKGYTAKIPSRFLEASESIYYCMVIPQEFIEGHYMERLLLETPAGRRFVPVKRVIRFQSGLREPLAPISFS